MEKKTKQKTKATQTSSINILDYEKEYNRALKANKPQNELMKNARLKNMLYTIIFLAILLAMFTAAAILLIVNALVDEPWITSVNKNGEQVLSSDTLYLGIILLVFLSPFILTWVQQIQTYRAIKRNTEIKQTIFRKYSVWLSAIIALGLFPLALVDSAEEFLSVGYIIYYLIVLILFALIMIAILSDIVHVCSKRRLLRNKSLVKIKAEFVDYKFKSSQSSDINGVPTSLSVNYNIIFTYEDENGVMQTKTSGEEFTIKEVEYLKHKKYFDILAYKGRAVIVEDLTNIDIPENDKMSYNPWVGKGAKEKEQMFLLFFCILS